MKPYFGLVCLLAFCAIGLTGCPKSAAEKTTAAVAGNGEEIYTRNGCASCHNGNAPRLDHIGSQHDSAWIVEHVRNPKAHKPGSRMPAYQGRISEADLKILGDYLAAKK